LLSKSEFIPLWVFAAISLAAISAAISSLEFLWTQSEFVDGVFAERVVRSRPFGIVGRRFDELRKFLFRPNLARVAVCVRLASSGVLFVGMASHELSVAALLGIAFAGIFLSYRNLIGGDGADQMTVIVILGLLPIAIFPHDVEIRWICAWFVSLQSVLSYLTAGIAKLVSPQWRSGRCLLPILRTSGYGYAPFAKRLEGLPNANGLLSWGVIIFEISFPFVLLGCKPLTITILVSGVVFHGFNAAVMGLNCFFWAFLATYPAIYSLYF
jgi:hypothetical protein